MIAVEIISLFVVFAVCVYDSWIVAEIAHRAESAKSGTLLCIFSVVIFLAAIVVGSYMANHIISQLAK